MLGINEALRDRVPSVNRCAYGSRPYPACRPPKLVARLLNLAYDSSEIGFQEIEDGRLVMHVISRLEEEPALLEPISWQYA